MTPWQCVGGCGAGGSGGVTGGIKWVGQGVSGGRVTVEVLPRYTFGRNFRFLVIPPRISFKPVWHTELGVSMPFSSRVAEVQYRSNQPANTMITGGSGDLTLDFSRILGPEGQFALNANLSFPTGQFDIRRGPDDYFLPVNLQMGSGVYRGELGLVYTRDIEDGFFLFEASFNYPFNMKPFTKENRFLDDYFTAYKNETGNARFYYRFKPYGESDLGDYVPPSLTAAFTYAYRGAEQYVHAFGANFSAPLGVGWIHAEKSTEYNPRPDPDHQAWNLVLIYGLEFSREKFPLFIGFGLPIHDAKASAKAVEVDEYDPSPMAKWNAPDWKDIGQQWIVAIGVKSTMF
jgi:hypothetical protein